MNNIVANKRKEINATHTGSAPLKQEARGESECTSQEAVKRRAYEIYQKNGCQNGTGDSDWYQAEEELSVENAQEKRASGKMLDEGAPASRRSLKNVV